MVSEYSLTYHGGVSLPKELTVVRTRARPMSPGERRSAILDAAIPLLRKNGREVSTKQLGFYLRLLAFGAAMPPVTSAHVFTLDELLELVAHGVLRSAASGSESGKD